MSILINFLPIILFVLIYVGGSLYLAFHGVENAFYQIPATSAIIPALILGWVLHKGDNKERMHQFLDGVRHRDIITMCIIFLLAGAFTSVTKTIGSVDATVNFVLSLVHSKVLLVGIFLTSAFISTAIGTSMGTIATIAPIAAGLAQSGAFPSNLAMATVVAGAMFGDNLSIISDTTIAAIMSQTADLRKKLKINVKIAIISSLITIIILTFAHISHSNISHNDYSFTLILPYIVLILMAICGINIFILLISALIFAYIIGYIHNGYSILHYSKDIAEGFASMQEIMLLSMLVGGLSGLASKGSKDLAEKLGHLIAKSGSKKLAQLLIAKIVSIFDILLANNTVAIIFSGEIAKDLAKKYHIPPHYSAAWLDIFSCVFQGLIPYGAQILLASKIGKVSPLAIVGNVYYCYVLGIISIIYILMKNKLND